MGMVGRKKILCQWSKRRVEKEKESCVLDNGGQLLEKLIESCGPKYNPFRIFSKIELKKSTNSYNQSVIFCNELYMGIHEGQNIAVKKLPDNIFQNIERAYRRMLSRRQSRRERHLQKESLVSRNGAILLEEVIKSIGPKYYPYHIFSEKELEIATNSYRNDHILEEDGFYVLYWGNHEDRKISVKKFTNNSISRIIDDFVISLQIRNHKNVLTILGCCLETEFPILVYEYSSKKTLSNLLHDVTVGKDTLPLENRPLALSWESKLRIATEIADAISYMHISTSTPIIHRDIKPSNILLDG
ncbi:hypothetical protein GIB67_033739 [Kingdonia uniflora]|uniref:Protein kinase domain-containing protein n=1 Tax=Kingdonia uniflora TaxID=39325 RepID=A0A7J7P427_9MAGN|nr:hypothetical protein GIB67_033739 [Kingdonia uniflora]